MKAILACPHKSDTLSQLDKYAGVFAESWKEYENDMTGIKEATRVCVAFVVHL